MTVSTLPLKVKLCVYNPILRMPSLGPFPQVVRQLRRVIEDPAFTPDQVAKQSKAAMSMCLWVRAMDTYAKVSKVGSCARTQPMNATNAVCARGPFSCLPFVTCPQTGLHSEIMSEMHHSHPHLCTLLA